MKTLALSITIALAACSGGSKPAPTTTSGSTSSVKVPVPGDEPAPPSCEEGMYLWDPTAKECRPFPGGPYGKAGCSEHETNPPGDHKCFTGSTWDKHCDCACDKGSWDAAAKACK